MGAGIAQAIPAPDFILTGEMELSKYLLGIDFGTGGAKACIIDGEANVLSYAFKEYPIFTGKPGWSEHDAGLYWPAACELIKECLTRAGVKPADIKGIGTSSALPSVVLVDKTGEPVQAAYNLMDRRAVREVQWLKDNIGEDRIFRISANRIDDHPLLVNLMWEKNNRPEDYKRIYKALTIDGYIRLKLTGRATMNNSSGAFYGVAYNILTEKFDEELMSKIGIDKELIPEIFPCEEIVGEVTAEAAAQTGLKAGIPVCAGQVDCNAGWIGGGAIEEGDIQMNLGKGNYGRCVYHCDNNVVDHQVVSLQFEDDITSAFTMSAFTNDVSRTIKIMGTEGEIRGAMEKNVIEVQRFGSDEKRLITFKPSKVGHGGGDLGIVKEFVDVVRSDGAIRGKASADVSVQGSLMAFAAEEARITNTVIDMKEFYKKHASKQ